MSTLQEVFRRDLVKLHRRDDSFADFIAFGHPHLVLALTLLHPSSHYRSASRSKPYSGSEEIHRLAA